MDVLIPADSVEQAAFQQPERNCARILSCTFNTVNHVSINSDTGMGYLSRKRSKLSEKIKNRMIFYNKSQMGKSEQPGS
jgi:hypothetical protein